MSAPQHNNPAFGCVSSHVHTAVVYVPLAAGPWRRHPWKLALEVTTQLEGRDLDP